ncbi:PTS system fructose-specific EIIABC component [Pontiella desulfatans]|uniref:PTS system fructose-specific EIIABC component n=1 Tax=Pontiella desulfatans TaxID=2750659 RepID=A0A6C2UAX9_PONDE|nr:PTS sugar transporter subunit IIA [Pontiella desulfatans]VGO17302.1 PTS system fructose-specific EIIABC component [Pontiella desulfatans]
MHEIMTIEEVAAYLRVSERTVYDWAQKGDLPGGKLGTTWRFKREDVENWVNSRISTKPASSIIGGVTSSATLTAERVVIIEETDKDTVLRQLVDLLAESPFVHNRAELLKGIFAREELMSTGIGFGIGVPHVRIDSVSDLVMAVAVCKRPISGYSSLDNEPVHIVCMLAARSDQHAKYIRTLSAVSSRLKDAATRERIIASDDPAFIHSQLISE